MTRTLSELREIAEKAVPGPWKAQAWGDGSNSEDCVNVTAPESEITLAEDVHFPEAAFIATFNPQVVLALLAVAVTLIEQCSCRVGPFSKQVTVCDGCTARAQLEAAGVAV